MGYSFISGREPGSLGEMMEGDYSKFNRSFIYCHTRGDLTSMIVKDGSTSVFRYGGNVGEGHSWFAGKIRKVKI